MNYHTSFSAVTAIVQSPRFGDLDKISSFSYFPFTKVTLSNCLILLLRESVIVITGFP